MFWIYHPGNFRMGFRVYKYFLEFTVFEHAYESELSGSNVLLGVWVKKVSLKNPNVSYNPFSVCTKNSFERCWVFFQTQFID